MTDAPALERDWPFYTEPTTIDVRGLATAIRRAGVGEPVLYLHGAGMTRRWLPMHARLAERVDLIVPEHPGFGDTPMPEWLNGFEDVVLHYDDLLERLEVDGVHLVGHSLGGWIAAKFAVLYPRRVRTLTLISPLGLRVPGAPVYDFFRMTPDEADEILFNGHADQFPEYLDEGDEAEQFIHSYEELTAAARMMFNPRYDIRLDRQLARVSSPALVIGVDDDRVVPASHCVRYAELLPDARLEVLHGENLPTSHLPFVQEPDRLAALIANFVTKGARS